MVNPNDVNVSQVLWLVRGHAISCCSRAYHGYFPLHHCLILHQSLVSVSWYWSLLNVVPVGSQFSSNISCVSQLVVSICVSAEGAVRNFFGGCGLPGCFHCTDCLFVLGVWDCIQDCVWLILQRNYQHLHCEGPAVDDKCPLLSLSTSGLVGLNVHTPLSLLNPCGRCCEDLINQGLFRTAACQRLCVCPPW
jgi:hypothetical protein